MEISKEIKQYIETEILPKYGEKVGGHTVDHIHQVIERSFNFAKQAKDVNLDMVYVIAAYHDLGRIVDDETHNIESGKMLRKDQFLKEHFSAADIETMAEAVEDHRASLGREPRSIYGKIVSSADRNNDLDHLLTRAYDYFAYLNPEASKEEIIEDTRLHLLEKYTPNGYAAKTMYFDDPDFAKMLSDVERITKNFATFKKALEEYYPELKDESRK